MGVNCCDLEVDVNGEEVFMVYKNVISLWSGRLRKLFGRSIGKARYCKVLFDDVPGGPEAFEIVSRFCYNNGSIDISPFNVSVLNCAAQFMEMSNSVAERDNLTEQTGKLLQEISYWTWSDLLVTLKQCQDLNFLMSSSGVVEKCAHSLVGRMALPSESSPCPSTSSPDSSGLRCSFDTKSTESFKISFSRATWWFEDLLFINTNLLEVVVKSMLSRKFDHGIISKFLLYYQKSKSFAGKSDEKRRIVETVGDMLHILDWSTVSCKSLFGILRVALSLNIRKSSQKKLESMIGSHLDQATLDSLLIPSPIGTSYLYDVNLVLRLSKAYIRGGTNQTSPTKLRKAAHLIDLYLAEVVPDPCLEPSKFMALATALPDSARESFDEIYHALDMYIEVHAELSEAEKTKMCCVLNYEKLSAEVCTHLSENKKFPSKIVAQAILSQKLKLKGLLHPGGYSLSNNLESGSKGTKAGADDTVVLYAMKCKDTSTENEKLREHIQRMQWRVMELEKVCKKMQTQMSKIMKSRVASPGNSRSLSKLCS